MDEGTIPLVNPILNYEVKTTLPHAIDSLLVNLNQTLTSCIRAYPSNNRHNKPRRDLFDIDQPRECIEDHLRICTSLNAQEADYYAFITCLAVTMDDLERHVPKETTERIDSYISLLISEFGKSNMSNSSEEDDMFVLSYMHGDAHCNSETFLVRELRMLPSTGKKSKMHWNPLSACKMDITTESVAWYTDFCLSVNYTIRFIQMVTEMMVKEGAFGGSLGRMTTEASKQSDPLTQAPDARDIDLIMHHVPALDMVQISCSSSNSTATASNPLLAKSAVTVRYRLHAVLEKLQIHLERSLSTMRYVELLCNEMLAHNCTASKKKAILSILSNEGAILSKSVPPYSESTSTHMTDIKYVKREYKMHEQPRNLERIDKCWNKILSTDWMSRTDMYTGSRANGEFSESRTMMSNLLAQDLLKQNPSRPDASVYNVACDEENSIITDSLLMFDEVRKCNDPEHVFSQTNPQSRQRPNSRARRARPNPNHAEATVFDKLRDSYTNDLPEWTRQFMRSLNSNSPSRISDRVLCGESWPFAPFAREKMVHTLAARESGTWSKLTSLKVLTMDFDSATEYVSDLLEQEGAEHSLLEAMVHFYPLVFAEGDNGMAQILVEGLPKSHWILKAIREPLASEPLYKGHLKKVDWGFSPYPNSKPESQTDAMFSDQAVGNMCCFKWNASASVRELDDVHDAVREDGAQFDAKRSVIYHTCLLRINIAIELIKWCSAQEAIAQAHGAMLRKADEIDITGTPIDKKKGKTKDQEDGTDEPPHDPKTAHLGESGAEYTELIAQMRHQCYSALMDHIPMMTYMIHNRHVTDTTILGYQNRNHYDTVYPRANRFFSADLLPNLRGVLLRLDFMRHFKRKSASVLYILSKVFPSVCQIRRIGDMFMTDYKSDTHLARFMDACVECSVLGLYPHSNHGVLASNVMRLVSMYHTLYVQKSQPDTEQEEVPEPKKKRAKRKSKNGSDDPERTGRFLLIKRLCETNDVIQNVFREVLMFSISRSKELCSVLKNIIWRGAPFVTWEGFCSATKNNCDMTREYWVRYGSINWYIPSESPEKNSSTRRKKTGATLSAGTTKQGKEGLVLSKLPELLAVRSVSNDELKAYTDQYGQLLLLFSGLFTDKETDKCIALRDRIKCFSCALLGVEACNRCFSEREAEEENILLPPPMPIAQSFVVSKRKKTSWIKTGVYRLYTNQFCEIVRQKLNEVYYSHHLLDVSRGNNGESNALLAPLTPALASKLTQCPWIGSLSRNHFQKFPEIVKWLVDECGLTKYGAYIFCMAMSNYMGREAPNQIEKTLSYLSAGDYVILRYYIEYDQSKNFLHSAKLGSFQNTIRTIFTLRKRNHIHTNFCAYGLDGPSADIMSTHTCFDHPRFYTTCYCKCCRRLAAFPFGLCFGHWRVSDTSQPDEIISRLAVLPYGSSNHGIEVPEDLSYAYYGLSCCIEPSSQGNKKQSDPNDSVLKRALKRIEGEGSTAPDESMEEQEDDDMVDEDLKEYEEYEKSSRATLKQTNTEKSAFSLLSRNIDATKNQEEEQDDLIAEKMLDTDIPSDEDSDVETDEDAEDDVMDTKDSSSKSAAAQKKEAEGIARRIEENPILSGIISVITDNEAKAATGSINTALSASEIKRLRKQARAKMRKRTARLCDVPGENQVVEIASLGRILVTSSRSGETTWYMLCPHCGNMSVHYTVLWNNGNYMCSTCAMSNGLRPITVYDTFSGSIIAVTPDSIKEICGVVESAAQKKAQNIKSDTKEKRTTVRNFIAGTIEDRLPPIRVNASILTEEIQPKAQTKKRKAPEKNVVRSFPVEEIKTGASGIGSVRELEHSIDVVSQALVLHDRVVKYFNMVFYVIDDRSFSFSRMRNGSVSRKFSLKRMTISKTVAVNHFYLNNAQFYTHSKGQSTIDLKYMNMMLGMRTKDADGVYVS